MTITLSGDTGSRLNQGVQSGNAIELPFHAPVFWTVNGDARMKNAGGAQYFGGWAVAAEDWQKFLEDSGMKEDQVPSVQRTDIVTADGKTLDVYTCRNLLVAPIATRTTWITQKEGGSTSRSSQYSAGSRQNCQALVYLATGSPEKGFTFLNAVLLTAKGYQAKNLLDAFASWNRVTARIRSKVAPGVPAWCFLLSVGTFGDKRVQNMVGNGGSQSPITPIGAYIPKDISEALMEKLFVGEDIAEAMVNYLDSAQEWIHAYDSKPGATNGNGGGAANAYHAPEAVYAGPSMDELPPAGGQFYDDIPF